MLRRAALMATSGLTSAGVVSGVIQDDWEKINQICKAGRAKDFYSIGSYKPLALLNGKGTVNMYFVGVNKEIRADEQCLPTTTWGSNLSKTVSLNDLPESIRDNVVEVIKPSVTISRSSYISNHITYDVVAAYTNWIVKEKIWTPTAGEISASSLLYGEASSILSFSPSLYRSRGQSSHTTSGYNGSVTVEKSSNDYLFFCL